MNEGIPGARSISTLEKNSDIDLILALSLDLPASAGVRSKQGAVHRASRRVHTRTVQVAGDELRVLVATRIAFG